MFDQVKSTKSIRLFRVALGCFFVHGARDVEDADDTGRFLLKFFRRCEGDVRVVEAVNGSGGSIKLEIADLVRIHNN